MYFLIICLVDLLSLHGFWEVVFCIPIQSFFYSLKPESVAFGKSCVGPQDCEN